MNQEIFNLSLEEEFSLLEINNAVDNMDLESLRVMLKELARQLKVKDRIVKHLVKEKVQSGNL